MFNVITVYEPLNPFSRN